MEKKEIKENLTKYALTTSKVFLFLIVFAIGYISSDLYHRVKGSGNEKNEGASVPKITKKIDKVSVAINERNELMIIDRTDGSYEIYQDSVGRCIFNLYANSIQTKYQNQ